MTQEVAEPRPKICWETRMPFGKHKGVMLHVVLATDKPWLRWCWENEIHMARPEVAFIFENISSNAMKDILRAR